MEKLTLPGGGFNSPERGRAPATLSDASSTSSQGRAPGGPGLGGGHTDKQSTRPIGQGQSSLQDAAQKAARLSLEEFLQKWAEENLSAAAHKASPFSATGHFPFARTQVVTGLAKALREAGYVR